jgi:hypothetical protein
MTSPTERQAMKQAKLLTLSVVAIAALAAITASAATAIEGPFYRIEKSRLLENIPVEAKLAKEYQLKNAIIEIHCTAQKLESSSLLGSQGANSGSSIEIVVFEGCAVIKNGEACEPYSEKTAGKKEPGIIRTKPLTGALDFANKASVKGEILLIIFEPVKKPPVFVTVKFTGVNCKVTSLAIEGSIAAEVWEGAGKAVKVEETETEAEIGFVNFPAAQIKVDFIEEEGVRKEAKPSLKAAGLATELTGRTELKLPSKEKWGIVTK